jgi:uncharacterized protein
MDAALELKDIVSMVVCGLCDLPNRVEIRTADIEGKHVFITVICAKEDIKRVVGKEGRNISALRTLAQAVSTKHNQKMTIAIDE